MMKDLKTPEEIERHVIANFPHFVSVATQRFAEKRDPIARGRLYVDLLTSLLKYLAVVTHAEYLRSEMKDEELTDIICYDFGHPLVSTWKKFILCAILKLKQAGHRFQVPELEGALEELNRSASELHPPFREWQASGKRRGKPTVVEALIQFRNTLAHSTTPDDAALESAIAVHRGLLCALLQRLSWAAEYALVVFRDDEALSLMGLHMRPFDAGIVRKPEDTTVCLVERGSNLTLGLSPFLITPGELEPHLRADDAFLVYEKRTSNRVFYSNPRGVELESKVCVERWQRLIAEKRAPFPLATLAESVAAGEFHYRCKELTKRTRATLVRTGKVIPALSCRRPIEEGHIEAWLSSRFPLFILSGRAGAGKTSILDRVTESQLTSGRAVLLMRANIFGKGELLAQLGSPQNLHVKLTAEGLVAALKKRMQTGQEGRIAGQWLLLVDGMDECRHPASLLTGLLALAKAGGLDGPIKILLSVRGDSISWPELSPEENFLAYNPFQGSEMYGSGIERMARVEVSPLRTRELTALWEKYTGHEPDEVRWGDWETEWTLKNFRPLFTLEELQAVSPAVAAEIRNPLSLRIFLEVFDGRTLPAGMTGSDLWSQYYQHLCTRCRDEGQFLRGMARLMLERQALEIGLDELYDDEKTAAGMEMQSETGAFVQLRRAGALVENISASSFEPSVVTFFSTAVAEYVLAEHLWNEMPELHAGETAAGVLARMLRGRRLRQESGGRMVDLTVGAIQHVLRKFLEAGQREVVIQFAMAGGIDEVKIVSQVLSSRLSGSAEEAGAWATLLASRSESNAVDFAWMFAAELMEWWAAHEFNLAAITFAEHLLASGLEVRSSKWSLRFFSYLSSIYLWVGFPRRGMQAAERFLELCGDDSENFVSRAIARWRKGVAQWQTGLIGDAIQTLEEASAQLAKERSAHGELWSFVTWSLSALLLDHTIERERGLLLTVEVLEWAHAVYGPKHPVTLDALVHTALRGQKHAEYFFNHVGEAIVRDFPRAIQEILPEPTSTRMRIFCALYQHPNILPAADREHLAERVLEDDLILYQKPTLWSLGVRLYQFFAERVRPGAANMEAALWQRLQEMKHILRVEIPRGGLKDAALNGVMGGHSMEFGELERAMPLLEQSVEEYRQNLVQPDKIEIQVTVSSIECAIRLGRRENGAAMLSSLHDRITASRGAPLALESSLFLFRAAVFVEDRQLATHYQRLARRTARRKEFNAAVRDTVEQAFGQTYQAKGEQFRPFLISLRHAIVSLTRFWSVIAASAIENAITETEPTFERKLANRVERLLMPGQSTSIEFQEKQLREQIASRKYAASELVERMEAIAARLASAEEMARLREAFQELVPDGSLTEFTRDFSTCRLAFSLAYVGRASDARKALKPLKGITNEMGQPSPWKPRLSAMCMKLLLESSIARQRGRKWLAGTFYMAHVAWVMGSNCRQVLARLFGMIARGFAIVQGGNVDIADFIEDYKVFVSVKFVPYFISSLRLRWEATQGEDEERKMWESVKRCEGYFLQLCGEPSSLFGQYLRLLGDIAWKLKKENEAIENWRRGVESFRLGADVEEEYNCRWMLMQVLGEKLNEDASQFAEYWSNGLRCVELFGDWTHRWGFWNLLANMVAATGAAKKGMSFALEFIDSMKTKCHPLELAAMRVHALYCDGQKYEALRVVDGLWDQANSQPIGWQIYLALSGACLGHEMGMKTEANEWVARCLPLVNEAPEEVFEAAGDFLRCRLEPLQEAHAQWAEWLVLQEALAKRAKG